MELSELPSRAANARLFDADGGRVLVIRLTGETGFSRSRENALRLAARLRAEARAGLVFDYSAATLSHTVAQYAQLAALFAEAFPAGLRIGYAYAPENMMHAAMMTKTLARAGFPAAAFRSVEEAVGFACA